VVSEDDVSSVVWESPNRTRYDWQAIAEQLMSEPMKWGKVFDKGPTSTVNAVRQGNVKHVRPQDGFEVRTTNNVREPARLCTFYLRFNPAKVVT
jgi:hypothetical protein